MVEIKRVGKQNTTLETFYTYTCKRCGCIFTFTKNDFKSSYARGYLFAVKLFDVVCPHCKQHVIMSDNDLNNLEAEEKEIECDWQEERDSVMRKYWGLFNND